MSEQINQERTERTGSVTRQRAGRKGLDVEQLLKETTSLWQSNLADLVLLTFVLCLLIWIPVLNIAIMAGYVRALLKVVRGQKPVIKDLFSAWDCFGWALVYGLAVFIGEMILGTVPVLGWFLGMVLLVVATPGFFAIVDSEMTAFEASKWSIEAFRSDSAGWVIVLLIGTLVGNAGWLVLVVGALFTLPWGYLLIARQYDKQKALIEF